MSKNIIFITSFFPFGSREVWLKYELECLVEGSYNPIVVPRMYEGNVEKVKAINPDINVINEAMISLRLLGFTLFNFLKIFSIKNLKLITAQSQDGFDWLKRLSVLPKTYVVLDRLRVLEVSHVHSYSTTTVATIGTILSRELDVPFSFTLHTSAQLTEKYRTSYKSIIQKSSLVRTISEKTKRDLQLFFGDILPPVHCVHLGVNCNSVSVQEALVEAKNPDVRIVIACVLEPYKGVHYAIDAIELMVEKFKNFKVDIYGDGSCSETLKSLVVDKNLTQHISFKGYVPHAVFMETMQNMVGDILLLTSDSSQGQQEEGIPVIVMEAMNAGMITIATKNGGISEIIDDKQNGFLVAQRDIGAMVAAMAEVCNMNMLDKAKLISRAKTTVNERFNSNKNAATLAGLMTDVTL
jgi:glycosyltransferase involved in cell wall biosynthesis